MKVWFSSYFNYMPPKSLGEGLNRIKSILNCGELISNNNGHRLYRGKEHGTVYMTIGELHKTKGIVPAGVKPEMSDYDTYAGTVLRLRNSANCGKKGLKPNQLVEFIRARFFSDAVKSASGVESKPIHAITDFAVINTQEGKPAVEYGWGKYYNIKPARVPNFIKEIKSEDVPKAYKGVVAHDGNVVYYLKDTEKNGKRLVEMKMYENGIDVPIVYGNGEPLVKI